MTNKKTGTSECKDNRRSFDFAQDDIFGSVALEPLQFAEDVEEEEGGDDGDAADPLGAVGGVLEGQALEIHAVDAGDAERRQGDGAKDCQDLHDFIGAVGDRGEIDVEGVVEEVALSF